MQDNDEVRYSATLFDKITRGQGPNEESVTYSLEELKSSIRENIESILNTRSQYNINYAPKITGRHSMYYFGLSDYSLQNLSDASVAEEFAQEAQKAIENFEPRLKNVIVSFANHNKESEGSSFHLKISAELKQNDLQNYNTELTFNTTLIPIKRQFDIDIAK